MKALLAIAAIILAAASFAGCSSGDDTGSTTGADNTTSQSTTDGANSQANAEQQAAQELKEIKAIACSLYKEAAAGKFSSDPNTLASQVSDFLATKYPPGEAEKVASDWTTQIETLRAGTGGTTLKRAIKEVC